MNGLTQQTAQSIIQEVGGTGQPPPYGIQFFTVGLDEFLAVIDEEYLSSYVKNGGGVFKLVEGIYGGGKTHFLYSVRDLAWKQNFVISYVSLKAGESPFHQLDLVYKAIVRGLLPPLSPDELLEGPASGIDSLLRTWYARRYQAGREQGLIDHEFGGAIEDEIQQIGGTDSVSFGKAIRAALGALHKRSDSDFEAILQWLKGEGFSRSTHNKFDILQRIDRTTAFSMIRSLGQVVRQLDYSGLVILLDEAERVPSLSTRQREQHLGNLREVIDECGHSTFQGMMLFYAVPDDNFLEGRTQVYEALKQRLSTVFTIVNPTGVKIKLEDTVAEPTAFLHEVGDKLVRVYQTAYRCTFDPAISRPLVQAIAEDAYEQRFSDEGYKRLFVQKLVRGLHFLRRAKRAPTIEELE